MPIELMKQLRTKLNLTDLTVAYGMSKSTRIAASPSLKTKVLTVFINSGDEESCSFIYSICDTHSYFVYTSSPVSFQTTLDDPVVKRVETVGKVHPHTKAKLVNAEGEVVPVGTPGEVIVAGYLLQKGYGAFWWLAVNEITEALG